MGLEWMRHWWREYGSKRFMPSFVAQVEKVMAAGKQDAATELQDLLHHPESQDRPNSDSYLSSSSVRPQRYQSMFRVRYMTSARLTQRPIDPASIA